MLIDGTKENAKGAKRAKLLKRSHNSERHDSLVVLMMFYEELLPSKVCIGYISYDVRLFFPPP